MIEYLAFSAHHIAVAPQYTWNLVVGRWFPTGGSEAFWQLGIKPANEKWYSVHKRLTIIKVSKKRLCFSTKNLPKKSQNHQLSNLNKSAGSADIHEIFLPKGIYMMFARRSKSMDILVMIPLRYWNFRCQIAKKPISKIQKNTFWQKFLQDAEISAQYFVKKTYNNNL